MTTHPSPLTAQPQNVIYRERLSPSPGMWAASHILIIGIFLIALPFSAQVAITIALVSELAMVIILFVMSPQIMIHDQWLTAGRASIELEFLGSVTLLDHDMMTEARGTGLDARAYLCAPGWLHSGARIELIDPSDPTPYWLLASREPEELARALQKAKGLGAKS